MSDRKRKNNERPKRNSKKPRTYKEDDSSDSETDIELEEDAKKLLHFLDMITKDSDADVTFSFGDDIVSDSDDNPYDKYLNSLSNTKRKKLKKLEEKILKFNSHDIPLRYKILESNLEDKVKAQLLQKAIHFESLSPIQGEYFKLKKYMDGILKIPFNHYSKIPVKKNDSIVKIQNFMQGVKNKLDSCIYGQDNAKQSILQIIAKWVTNPKSTGNIIGLHGPPGIGKTSLIKNGLSKALNMPFSFITLGGSTNASTLEGFDYTFEGSKWGRIVDILMENKCMNPVIFFDELDKISETKAGEEIAALLIHLTDPTQNNSFADRYFSGIDFDLSKAFLIFSFNDINRIHPVLRDRITAIPMDGFTILEKIKIATDFSLTKICKNIGMDRNKIIIPEETLRVIVATYCPEKGIRKLEKCLETLIMKINLYDMTKDLKNLTLKGDLEMSEPYHIDAPTATRLLDPVYRKDEMPISVRMMYS